LLAGDNRWKTELFGAVPWWDESVYEYDDEAILESVLDKKRLRATGLVLSKESYSFVTIISRF
jgi:hypothetical protein